jgi:hypothetical protein
LGDMAVLGGASEMRTIRKCHEIAQFPDCHGRLVVLFIWFLLLMVIGAAKFRTG